MADQPLPGRGPSKPGLIAYVLAVLVIALDQFSKSWVLHGLRLPERPSVEVLPFFHLTMVWNRGVSFGLLHANTEVVRWGLVAFSCAVAVALAVWAWRIVKPLTATAVGLIIGGAVGNLIDRARFGAVVDFLDFSGLHFPWVFNVADSAINIGVALLLLEGLLVPQKAPPR